MMFLILALTDGALSRMAISKKLWSLADIEYAELPAHKIHYRTKP